jgi:TonB family protein
MMKHLFIGSCWLLGSQVAYRFLLRRRIPPQAGRFYLLASLLLALWAPALPLPEPSAGLIPEFSLPAALLPASSSAGPQTPDAWLLAYAAGAGLLLAYGLLRLGRLLLRIARAPRVREGRFLRVPAQSGSFASWFCWLFWDASIPLSESERRAILAHEDCHRREGHSLDILLAQLARAIYWFHPAAWLLLRDLSLEHEYAADRAALQHLDQAQYSRLLLGLSLGGRLPFAHSLTASPLKSRFDMLYAHLSPRAARQRLAAASLVLLLSGILASCVQQRKLAKDAEAVGAATVIEAGTFSYEQMVRESNPSPAAPGIEDTLRFDKPPLPTNFAEVQRAIGYPEEARQQRQQGLIVVRVLVDTQGQYQRHEVVQSESPLLSAAVEAQVPKLKFTPATKDGQPMMAWVNLPFKFKLLD